MKFNPKTDTVNEGCYTRTYKCKKCNIKVGYSVHNHERIVIASSILKDNTLPTYCPKCGSLIGAEFLNEGITE